jgi:phage terminase small subunit
MSPAPQESDLPAELKEDGASDDATGPIVLSPEQRKQFLGKLAEFEIQLSALTEKRANFVLAVLRDPTNWEKAARTAGFKNASVEAARMRHAPDVMACIALGENIREDRTLLTSDRTMHEFAIIAFSDITDFRVDKYTGEVTVAPGVPEYATRAISKIKWKHKTWTEDGELHTQSEIELGLWNKNDALKMIAMYQKLLSGEAGSGMVIDNSKHVHVHQHQHNTWQVGDNKLTF